MQYLIKHANSYKQNISRVLTKFVSTPVIKHASYQRLCCELVGLWNCKFTEDVINCTLTIKLDIPFTDQDWGHIPPKFLGLTGVSLH